MHKNTGYSNDSRLGWRRNQCAILMRIRRESVDSRQKKINKLPTRESRHWAQASTGEGQLAVRAPRSATSVRLLLSLNSTY